MARIAPSRSRIVGRDEDALTAAGCERVFDDAAAEGGDSHGRRAPPARHLAAARDRDLADLTAKVDANRQARPR